MDVAELQRVAVQRGEFHVAVLGEESAGVCEPLRCSDRWPSQRYVRQRAGDPREVAAERGEVVVVGASRLARAAPGERPVQLGLVTQLERLDPVAPDPATSWSASVWAILSLSASRLMPSVSLAPVAVASALVVAIQPGVRVSFTPAGVGVPGIGHQVRSVVSPPILSWGVCPGDRFRISWTNTGFIAEESVPAYAGIAKYSIESPRNPAGIARFVAGPPTVSTVVVAAGPACATDARTRPTAMDTRSDRGRLMPAAPSPKEKHRPGMPFDRGATLANS